MLVRQPAGLGEHRKGVAHVPWSPHSLARGHVPAEVRPSAPAGGVGAQHLVIELVLQDGEVGVLAKDPAGPRHPHRLVAGQQDPPLAAHPGLQTQRGFVDEDDVRLLDALLLQPSEQPQSHVEAAVDGHATGEEHSQISVAVGTPLTTRRRPEQPHRDDRQAVGGPSHPLRKVDHDRRARRGHR